MPSLETSQAVDVIITPEIHHDTIMFSCVVSVITLNFMPLFADNGPNTHAYPAEGYGIKYEGSFLEKSQSGCVQNFCHFVCLHHFWA